MLDEAHSQDQQWAALELKSRLRWKNKEREKNKKKLGDKVEHDGIDITTGVVNA